MSDLHACEAVPECEHSWVYRLRNKMSVRICRLCHEPDWDYEAEKQAEVESSSHNFVLTATKVVEYIVACHKCGSRYTTYDRSSAGDWMANHAHHIQTCCNCDSAEERAGGEEECCGCACHVGVEQRTSRDSDSVVADDLGK